MKPMKNFQYRFYDQSQLTLVCRVSDHENNNIGDGYYLVNKDEWECEDDSLGLFHLILTEISDDQIKIFRTENGDSVVFQSLPYNRKKEYMEV